jgi:hypothetical protein
MENNWVDVVYVLGKGSPWDNNELRYSLRSLEKHVSEYRNIYIIGECPSFLQNIIHIPYDDEHPEKDTRIALKILDACHQKDISEQFLFMNDDHFITKSFNAIQLPFFHKGIIATEMNLPELNYNYKQTLLNTNSALIERGYPAYNFDTHTPIIYNKKIFPIIFNLYNWNLKYSYAVKSIYCNTLGLFGKYMDDCKILKRHDYSTLESLTSDKQFFSISDSAIGDSLEKLLNTLFPNKSKYEK